MRNENVWFSFGIWNTKRSGLLTGSLRMKSSTIIVGLFFMSLISESENSFSSEEMKNIKNNN
ncbi:hypothetical protein DXU93_11315 [Brumimicrobium aurantiacum]|uniref:Uncharacterized protein n=1 Tax=Brumimicrobium aurantiacum TaxID=1737063 RepID=A0A3E1EVX8_9FLAO|nr:hypothetical protein DXU93_11315 [Brumimicrobium aurantiacum]